MESQDSPIVVSTSGDRVRVQVIGPIHLNVAWLEKEFARIVEQKPKLVEMDLSQTRYVSSLGLGVLVAFSRGVAKAGGALRIVAIDEANYKVFRHAYLTEMFGLTAGAIVKPPA